MKKSYRNNSRNTRSNLNRAAIGSILLVAILGVFASAQDINLSASVNSTQIDLGGSIELNISVSGPVRSIAEPILPDLSAFDVYSSGKSSNISIVPGSFNYQTSYNYILMPRKAGKFIIDPVTVEHAGKIYHTEPITIKVTSQSQPQNTPQSQPKSQQGSRNSNRNQPVGGADFFIEQDVDMKNPYVGQQVTLVFRFYLARNLYENPSIQWPELNNLWVDDLPPQRTYNKSLNGRNYRVTEIRKAIFPTVTGKITIEPTVMTIPPSAFDNFFDFDPFNMFNRRQRSMATSKRLQTRSITLDVKPLPTKGKPANFSGAVGTYNFHTYLDLDSAEVDQPVTLEGIVTGTGNIKKLPGITMPELENFRLYDSGTSDNIQKDNYRVSGSKTQEWVLIPRAPGEYTLPKLEFSFFDPYSKKYRTISRNPGQIMVKPSSIASSNPADLGMNIIPAERTALNYIITDYDDRQPGKPIFESRLIWLIQLLPLLWLVGLTFYVNYRKRLEGDVAYARRKLASRAARKALTSAREGFDNPGEFYSLLYTGVVGYISDKLNITASGMTNDEIIKLLRDTGKCGDFIEDFNEFLDQCDAGRFSPVKPDSEQMDSIYQRAEQLLTRLDKNL